MRLLLPHNPRLFLALGQLATTSARVPAACGAKIANEAGGKHYLKADPSTVQWGYFFENVKPSLVVPSGAEVTVEMITHHAGDDPDKLIKGDKGMFYAHK